VVTTAAWSMLLCSRPSSQIYRVRSQTTISWAGPTDMATHFQAKKVEHKKMRRPFGDEGGLQTTVSFDGDAGMT